MSEQAQTLARPLAARVNGLPQVLSKDVEVSPPEVSVDGAVAALDAGKTKYTDRPGILPLRQWIAAHLTRRFGVPCEADEITVTCAGTEARFVCVKVFCEPGTQLLCPGDPAEIAGAAALTGVDLIQEVDDPAKISAMYLSADVAREIADPLLTLAKEHNWWVIYEPFYGSPTHHPAQDEALRPRVVSIGSFEGRMPGWRIGWMAGSEAHKKLRAYKQSMTICTPSVSQWAVLAMVEAQ